MTKTAFNRLWRWCLFVFLFQIYSSVALILGSISSHCSRTNTRHERSAEMEPTLIWGDTNWTQHSFEKMLRINNSCFFFPDFNWTSYGLIYQDYDIEGPNCVKVPKVSLQITNYSRGRKSSDYTASSIDPANAVAHQT